MSDFQLSSVKQIRKFSSNNVAALNKHLADGWVLISAADGKDETGYPLTLYTVGWAKDEAPQQEHEY